MIRTFAAAGGLSLVAFGPIGLAGAATAQTWGQPVYVSPYGHVVGGTPLSEVETRSHVATGRWADGYADQARVLVPASVHGARHGDGYRRHDGRLGHGRYGRGYGYGYDRGHGYGYGHGRQEPRPGPGYHDVWGYNDDRPPSARGWSRAGRSHRYDPDCGCGDGYLYDR